ERLHRPRRDLALERRERVFRGPGRRRRARAALTRQLLQRGVHARALAVGLARGLRGELAVAVLLREAAALLPALGVRARLLDRAPQAGLGGARLRRRRLEVELVAQLLDVTRRGARLLGLGGGASGEGLGQDLFVRLGDGDDELGGLAGTVAQA